MVHALDSIGTTQVPSRREARAFRPASAPSAWGGIARSIMRPRNPYYAGPISDHFDGRRFFNPGGTPPSGFLNFLRWQFGARRQRWPERVPLPPTAPPQPRVANLAVTMVGHATLLIQTAEMNILTDPVWSDRASPLRLAGPRRVIAPGLNFDDLPPIDLVLLSHNHYDHLDLETLARLSQRFAMPILTPLGNDAILRAAHGDLHHILARDWGQSESFGPLTLHLVPCHHWSARGARDRSMALWSAFVIEGPAGRIHVIGDTGFDGGRPYRNLPGDGPLRLSVIPIGAYQPRWFMEPQHQDPAQAVQGFRISGAAWGVGHHWGTFQLTDEARETPLEDLATALADQGIAPERFRALAPGQCWAVPPVPQPD